MAVPNLSDMRHFLSALAIGVLIAAAPARDPRTDASAAIEAKLGTVERDLREAVKTVYSERGFSPVWFDADGRATLRAQQLLSWVCEVEGEGLDPSDYPADRLREAFKSPPAEAAALAEVDLLFTQTFMQLATHIRNGRVHPDAMNWHFEPQPLDLAAELRAAHDRGDVAAHLRSLRPPHPQYEPLRARLDELRKVQAWGGYPKIAAGPVLEEGARDPRVVTLRHRLGAEGEPVAQVPEEAAQTFDAAVVQALQRFQQRHGLVADGKLGPNTVEALNTPVEKRIEQLVLNLERLRWLPSELGERHVLVNVAGYWLEARHGGRVVLRSPIVVGKQDWQTPMFSDEIIGAEVNPDWHVPRSIVDDEVVPLLQRAPGWAASERMVILDRETGQPVPAEQVTPANSDNFIFVQRPGPKNPLGEAKFRMPNRFSIFLHGTKAPEIFEQPHRALSHGCIRVKELEPLARFVFGDEGYAAKWQPAAASGQKTMLDAEQPVPVHIIYLTAWVDEAGALQLRPDLYWRDARLKKLLDPEANPEAPAYCQR